MNAHRVFGVALVVSLGLVGCGGDSESGGAGGQAGGATGGSGGTTSVTCGSATCGSGQYCCHPNCVPLATSCSGFALHCDGASDCPGEICCAAAPAGGGFPVAKCQATCDSTNDKIVCLYAAPSCPPGKTCQITATLPTDYGFCG